MHDKRMHVSPDELELVRPAEAELLFPGCLTGLRRPWWASLYSLAHLDYLDVGKLRERDQLLGIDDQNNNLWYIDVPDYRIRATAWLWNAVTRTWERYDLRDAVWFGFGQNTE
jgi:hypothetical protein